MSGAQVIYPVSSCPLVSAGASLHFMVSWFTPSAAPVHVTAFEAASNVNSPPSLRPSGKVRMMLSRLSPSRKYPWR